MCGIQLCKKVVILKSERLCNMTNLINRFFRSPSPKLENMAYIAVIAQAFFHVVHLVYIGYGNV